MTGDAKRKQGLASHDIISMFHDKAKTSFHNTIKMMGLIHEVYTI